jgi:hypothetical protein
MKTRWRQHEATLVNIIWAILVARYVWEWVRLSPQEISAHYAAPFIKNHQHFNYFSRVLLPQVAAILVLALAYFRINQLIALCVSPTGRKSAWVILGAILQVAAIAYIIGPGINFLSFYADPYYMTNNTLWTYPFTFGFHPQPFQNVFGGLGELVYFLTVYLIYAAIREIIIYYVENGKTRRDYRIMILNNATLFVVLFLSIPVFLSVFNLVTKDTFYAYYFAFTPGMTLVFYTNVYVLFPRGNENSLFRWRLLGPVLLWSFIYTLVFSIFLGVDWSVPMLLGGWAVQLLFITPLSWLNFQQRRDKLLELRGIEQALSKSTADLQFLRMQINPHFLFNVLNTLYGTALLEGSTKTAEGIQKLGDMMRFMLHENTLDYIGMDKEIDYLKNYISLQKLRTQSSPDIVIEDTITEDVCNHEIAPMLLIPFVENAFKHGISLTEKSWIRIKLECDDQRINFEVRNSIHPSAATDPEREQSGIGLKNVGDRLKLLYPGRHHFDYGAQGSEFVASVTIQAKPNPSPRGRALTATA